jgi:DNA helicase-2/ATP-dependent DNA helicase PcrA
VPAFRLNRRHLPTALGLLAAATLAWYLVYSQLLVREMRRESEVHSRIVVRILSGLNDPSANAPIRTLVELSSEVQDLDFPIVYADVDGFPAYTANLPFAADPGDSASAVRILEYAKELARRNPPIVEPGLGTIYYGDTPTIQRLRWIPWLQVSAMACLLIAAAWMIRHNARTERERIWAAMARESAHQMATPLSSLAGWVEILRLPEEEREGMASLPAVAAEMEADLDRLEKVARRFEWIGRPVQKQPVEVRPLLRVLERYVRVRLPQLRRSVELQVDVAEGVPPVDGNAILLEWALENLIKNALDALAGSGGRIVVEAQGPSDRLVEIRVSDNGPGVSPEVRNTLFDPGISTKRGGWGVGLSLTRRIVEDVHGGRMYLAPTEVGATFVMSLPAAPRDASGEAAPSPGLGLRALLGKDPAGMWAGTFHAIGVRILRRDAIRLGWAPGFMIYDADDTEALVKRILRDELRMDLKRWPPRAVHSAISAAKNELTSPEAYAHAARDAFELLVAEVYPRYQKALRDANAFDFDDLLVKPVELFRSSPRVLERYRERFQFLLVDEYQDTNRAQYAFLRLLADAHQNLFVVGDDDQSIYGWRGADLRNILDFEQDFPSARVVRLEQNYRSTQTILDTANQVIAVNRNRKGKTLRTDHVGGERVTLVDCADEKDEAEWVTAEIAARRADDPEVKLKHFVVLYRTNGQSRAMEEGLLREGTPYRVIGGTRFYERREVKDALAYLRLVANPAADEAFHRVVNVPRRGIGDASLARLAEWANAHSTDERKVSLLEAAHRADEITEIRGPAARALRELAALIAKHAAMADRVPLAELLRSLVAEAGLLEALHLEDRETQLEKRGEGRLGNVESLIAGAADVEERLAALDPELLEDLAESGGVMPRAVDRFLEHVALVADIDQHDPRADAVSLMTLHNAKGLEFPVVFITGLEDGLFPMARAMDEPAQLEEERRLFYVGITRAERKLYLAHAARRRRGGEWKDSIPSSFLESVPRELVEVRHSERTLERASSYSQPWKTASRGFGTRRERLGFSQPPPRRAEPEDPSYQVDYSDSQEYPSLVKGARVRHPRFGPGTVKELSGFGAELKVTIEFDEVGRKVVVLKYANLEPDYD